MVGTESSDPFDFDPNSHLSVLFLSQNQELQMRPVLPVFLAIMMIGTVSCAGQTKEVLEVHCPGKQEGESIAVTIPQPVADEDGWIHPDELLRHDAAFLFLRDMEDLGCPPGRMEGRESTVEWMMEQLREAEDICSLTHVEITHRIDSEVEQRRATVQAPEDFQFWEVPLRQDSLLSVTQYSFEFCPWYKRQ